MVGMTGFEPAASAPPVRRSTRLTYIPTNYALSRTFPPYPLINFRRLSHADLNN